MASFGDYPQTYIVEEKLEKTLPTLEELRNKKRDKFLRRKQKKSSNEGGKNEKS